MTAGATPAHKLVPYPTTKWKLTYHSCPSDLLSIYRPRHTSAEYHLSSWSSGVNRIDGPPPGKGKYGLPPFCCVASAIYARFFWWYSGCLSISQPPAPQVGTGRFPHRSACEPRPLCAPQYCPSWPLFPFSRPRFVGKCHLFCVPSQLAYWRLSVASDTLSALGGFQGSFSQLWGVGSESDRQRQQPRSGVQELPSPVGSGHSLSVVDKCSCGRMSDRGMIDGTGRLRICDSSSQTVVEGKWNR